MDDLALRMTALADDLRRFDTDGTVGLYAHGSWVLDALNPERSDIDLIHVRRSPLTASERVVHLTFWLNRSREVAPGGVELHVMTEGALRDRRGPTAYDLHFSERHRQKAIDALETGRWTAPFTPGRDDELLGYVTLIREAGRRLIGPPAEALFRPVPRKLVVEMFRQETASAREALFRRESGGGWRPMAEYVILNACRTLCLVQEGRFTSKVEGGIWALDRLPEKYRPVVEAAIRAQSGPSAGGLTVDGPTVGALLDWIHGKMDRLSNDPASGAEGERER